MNRTFNRKVRPGWRPEHDDLLRECANSGMSVRRIVAALAEQFPDKLRSVDGVYRRAHRLKLSLAREVINTPVVRRRLVTTLKPKNRQLIEYCLECGGCPVSNWNAHFERTGHRRPSTQPGENK